MVVVSLTSMSLTPFKLTDSNRNRWNLLNWTQLSIKSFNFSSSSSSFFCRTIQYYLLQRKLHCMNVFSSSFHFPPSIIRFFFHNLLITVNQRPSYHKIKYGTFRNIWKMSFDSLWMDQKYIKSYYCNKKTAQHVLISRVCEKRESTSSFKCKSCSSHDHKCCFALIFRIMRIHLHIWIGIPYHMIFFVFIRMMIVTERVLWVHKKNKYIHEWKIQSLNILMCRLNTA